MNYTVKRLQPGDEPLALQTVRDLLPEDERDGREPTLLHLHHFLTQNTNYLIVATLGPLPVGFLTAYQMPALSYDGSMVYLYEIEVAPAHRRNGLGRQMIERLKTLCAQTDVEEIWVGTQNDNIPAKRLYESTGGVYDSQDNCELIYEL
jgi:ribosomal protein S18 acetylase RimI-like enzyme